jgi:hypothetical protein
MEEEIFPRPAVAGELSKMIEARLHYDGSRKQDIRKIQKDLLKSYAAPIYCVVDPATGAILRRNDGLLSEADFLKLLRGN